jgi:hypothetical protein
MALVAICALPLSGQAPRNRITNIEMTHPHTAPLPYTAEFKVTHVRTLADGSTITNESTEVEALDSAGRRMTATAGDSRAVKTLVNGDQTSITTVNVFDPVAHTNASWSVPGQKAIVREMPIPGAARPSCATATTGTTTSPVRILHDSAPNRIKPTIEDLGTETIMEIEARGRRTTTTTPAGTIGNNEPLVRISETWRAVAPGLRGLVLREVNDDPQSGKMTRELTSFNQSEPDASVFQPPADYEIVNREVGGCPSSSAASVEAPHPPADSASEPEQ